MELQVGAGFVSLNRLFPFTVLLIGAIFTVWISITGPQLGDTDGGVLATEEVFVAGFGWAIFFITTIIAVTVLITYIFQRDTHSALALKLLI